MREARSPGDAFASALVLALLAVTGGQAVILTPPYFNLAEGRTIRATATCGEGTPEPELYCKLVGANADRDANVNLIQGQVCDKCDPYSEDKKHPAEFAIDGAETWWQSPPLSRGMSYNEVNLTIDLGQEFHVAYVFIKMANSPRPGVWVLARSLDNGVTYQPWQYFADTESDCEEYFGRESLQPITRDDSVRCETQYSKVVPLEGGEIVVSLLNNRPSANDFFNSTVLQEWTRATNIQLRFLRTKTLLGHLMSVARQDPTVTRRYFYSIKDISIGGRCVCNGHADTCDITNPNDPYKLVCQCQHHTCGDNCDSCCPGYEQKAWRQSKANQPFVCEPCNCFGHSFDCVYDEEVDRQRLSLDIHVNYEGGGVCKNCRHNTEGINCNKCQPGYFRPYGKMWNDTDVCTECDCQFFYSTGNCAEESGLCECRPEFQPPKCDTCSFGYFGYPECRPCECHLNGTRSFLCEPTDGVCPCKPNFAGKYCNECEKGYYNFPECLNCECNPQGSISDVCDSESGQCTCKNNYGGRTCDQCQDGYAIYPHCHYCSCDVRGTTPGVCDKETQKCLCKLGYGGDRCDRCVPGYFGYPDCKPCNCSEVGSGSTSCDASGKCSCLSNFSGRTCNKCSPGYYQYPECLACRCDLYGSIGISCDNDGICTCKDNFDGLRCEECKEGFYNFPACEECNCDPAGVLDTFEGCGSVPAGELCQCKERVRGRICNECKPLFWNLQPANPDGCEECDCHVPGVVGGMGTCDSKSGQCLCKPSVTSRRCSECSDGTFDLQEQNLFGCTDCGCDIGGAVNNICDKETGQCACRPRIAGRTCKEPLQTHYFPTLHHHQYEAEDGRTPSYSPVRYGFDEDLFPGYSWRGYAVFSQLQDEIVHEVYIQRPSLYQIILRYINLNEDVIQGHIKIVPENTNDIEQSAKILFKSTGKTPSFVRGVSVDGVTPAALVMNPGRWWITIKNERSLFLDYFVLLPAAFYEATILVEKVDKPCEVGNKNLCRHFSYPSLSQFDTAQGNEGFLLDGGNRVGLNQYFSEPMQLEEISQEELPLLNSEQNDINFQVPISKQGPHVLLINYITPLNDQHSGNVFVKTQSRRLYEEGRVTLNACPYTELCRQSVLDHHGQVAEFDFDSDYVNITLEAAPGINIAIESIVAIPLHEWRIDYQQPQPACVRKDGSCMQAVFPTPPNSVKVEFETYNEDLVAQSAPNLANNKTVLVYLDKSDSRADIRGKVPNPGFYVYVVHYYQPDYPKFDLNVIIQNGQLYESKLDVQHCPSNSGCRSVIKQANGEPFQLTENFELSLNGKDDKGVWIDYILAIPNDQYTDKVLEEEPVDHTGIFITQCGQNHFYMDTNAQGFCRDAVFSLTADYNDGALPCHCNFEGSHSFECDKFGGQCPCKPNVIGRRCEACKTGYFGFPDCKPCSCPSTAVCDAYTGACICPPRVIGELCDKCLDYTYGFDPIIGCEECNCHNLGVEALLSYDGRNHPNLQCDLSTGNCKCRPNVVGRICDQCKIGHWGFPHCPECECDLRGTVHEICDQRTADCFCKNNVYGQACDLCKEGTFNLQSNNPEGCTKCFCSGKTSRCTSSSLYRAQVSVLENWVLATIDFGKTLYVEYLQTPPTRLEDAIGAKLTELGSEDKVVYFRAPLDYLGNQLTSYGGNLNYTLYYTTISESDGKAVGEPDVILQSGDIYLLHSSLEQPPEATKYSASVEIVESNFFLPNKQPATRDNLMQVLTRLDGVFIRATYWSAGYTTRLEDVKLDIAIEEYDSYAAKAFAVEQCLCPPNYKGLSCEECSPGYYRTQTGPFGGFCVPCQCNGHSDECDPVTGICIDCKNNTVGDHCELCAVGHYGNATHGTQVDCMICACPLPYPSNNFATSCEVSPDGEKIHCECIPGYIGPKCEACGAGFFGRPEIPGERCQECQCSGNINQEDPGACDSITGECLRCLNNTYGESCNLCEPGYFGDAVVMKDCQSCLCDKCGTHFCDNVNGECECHQNVIGDKCDRCDVDHFGFSSCQGCLPCDCAEAADSTQCDDETGKCRCKPGVTGRTCDRCIAGFWRYNSEGCVSCGCNEEYSVGVGCNATTGQCHCLPGVIGEKCDHCPHRWVLIDQEGCMECDSCTHDLLDVTDELRNQIVPIYDEFKTVALGYFTSQRLVYINKTAHDLTPQVKLLDPERVNLTPLAEEVESLEMDTRSLYKKANYSVDNAESWAPKADKVKADALAAEQLVLNAIGQSNAIVHEISQLSSNLEGRAGPQVDYALTEAQEILHRIQQQNFDTPKMEAEKEFQRSLEEYNRMREFITPAYNQSRAFKILRKEIHEFDDKLSDLQNQSIQARNIDADASVLNNKNKNSKLNDKMETVKNVSKEASVASKEGKELIANATELLADATQFFNELANGFQSINDTNQELSSKISSIDEHLQEVLEILQNAKQHAEDLEMRAEDLESELAESRFSTKNAVDAANAYKNIKETINNASHAAQDAQNPAKNATKMSEGLRERTGRSELRSSELLQKAQIALNKAQRELRPELERAMNFVDNVDLLNSDSERKDALINQELSKLGAGDDSGRRKAMENAEHAENMAQDASSQIEAIASRLPADVSKSKNLHRITDDANGFIEQATQQMMKLDYVLPNIHVLMGTIQSTQNEMNKTSSHFEDKLAMLRNKVARARELANRIKVGVTFYRNTTLSLHKPKDLSSLGTATRMSVYFKTAEPQGFLFYLGNDQSSLSRSHRGTGDFLALEIENGFPVLTIDLGAGPHRIIVDKKVDDFTWYQAVVERTGRTVQLTIYEEDVNRQQVAYTKKEVIPGSKYVLNLDPEKSKLYVGGYDTSYEMPEEIKSASFVGEMEELMIGDSHISLWNFIDAENDPSGSKERDKLINLQPSSGYRFNGDHCYVIVDGKHFTMRAQNDVILSFKTFANDGLLFLVGKENTFLSIELINGRVKYQFDLGNGPLELISPEKYNDGKWHKIYAGRDKLAGTLYVDDVEVAKDTAPGSDHDLKTLPKLYFGGNQKHRFRAVTKAFFDGCIDDVYINGIVVDLSQNLQAFGVTPGCPVQKSTILSFEERSPGYLHWNNASSYSSLEINFKFKTEVLNGLLFYITDRKQQNTLSLSLVGGELVLRSQLEELTTSRSIRFNDSHWHVVTAIHEATGLTLDIDDTYPFKKSASLPPITFNFGSIYFGGIPNSFRIVDGRSASTNPFIGCLGDATVNGMLINFANTTDRVGAKLDKCHLKDHELPQVLLPVDSQDPSKEITSPTDEKEFPEERQPPLPPLQPLPEVPPPPTSASTTTTSTTTTTTSTTTTTTTTTATPPTTPSTTSIPTATDSTPSGMCQLPLHPHEDPEATLERAFRFGAVPNSVIEYSAKNLEKTPLSKLKNKYNIAVEFKTFSENGILFYVDDVVKHIDFVALYLKDGKVTHGFNCGSGAAFLQSENKYNDGEWHRVVMRRENSNGILEIDDKEIVDGQSVSPAKTVDVEPPLFLGGLKRKSEESSKMKENMKGMNESFIGCIRKLQLDEVLVQVPNVPSGITPCSEKVEQGSYFAAEGGYIKARNNFRVGEEMSIDMYIKPRNISGILLSVHGRRDFLLLQMVDGNIKFSVDNGKGIIATEFKPTHPHFFCDGKWHEIQAVKVNNVISLSVDKQGIPPGIGTPGQSSTDTKNTLFIGGHAVVRKNLRGVVRDRMQYVGCIKDVNINGELQIFSPSQTHGNVTIDFCPTI